MRKHLLRILTVLCLVCFGACLFAACGETEENPDDQPTTYTLTYNANGGTGADVSESHKEGDKFKLKGADTFTREDYTLTGWNDGSKTYAPADDFTMPARNVTLKAQWEENGTTPPTPDTYTVTVTGDHVTATFDEQGPYAEGTTVKFSLKVDTGYELVSVKNGSATLTAGTDGKYSVTVAKANITITVTTKSTGSEEPQTYTVTVTGDHVTATFDEQGPYAEGATVKFSLKVDEGYELVSVKNGNDTLTAGTDGKYSVTVAKANITITVTTKTSGGEDKPTRSLSDFVNANVAEWGANGIQVVVRAKATGYDVDSINQNLKLVAGDKEYEAFDAHAPEGDSQIWTIHFGIETASEISAKTQLTLKDGTTTYENIANTADQQVAKVGNSTYSLTLEGIALYLNVTTEGGGEEPPVEVDREIKQTGDLDFYADDFFKLPLSAEDITWIQQNVAYVTVDGTRNGFQDNKGFLVDGAVIQIQAPGSKNAADKNEWTLIWYNQKEEPVAKTIAQRNWQPAPREGITSGGEGDSTDAWIYWNDDAAGAVTVTEVTLDEDETDGATVTAKFRSNTSTLAWGFQLFYNNTTDYSVGKTYRLTLTVTAKSNVTLAINGREYELTANVPTPVDMTFVYSFHLDNVVNYDYGTSLFDVQIHLAAETDYDVTFANIKWTEAPKVEYEKGELVEGALSQELVQSEEGKEKDKFILWWAADAGWGCGSAVTLTPDVSEVYKDGKIAFTYEDGSVDYSVQLFYSNTKLQDNTQYYVTLKIKLTAATDVIVKVNGKTVTLKAGQVNDVEVLFTNTAEAKDGKALSSLDIQFPGTELVDGVDKIGIEVSDIAWYTVKESTGGDEPTEKSISFSNAELKLVDGVVYLVMKVDSTLYTTDELATMKFFDKDVLDLVANKSTLVANGQSEVWFALNSIKGNDNGSENWFWGHIQINGAKFDGANGDLKPTDSVSETIVSSAEVNYHLSLNGGTQLIVICTNRPAATAPQYEATKVELKTENDNVYFVVSGTYKNYSVEDLKALLEGLDTNLQHVLGAAGNANLGYLVLKQVPHTVEVTDDGWTYTLTVTVGTNVVEDGADAKPTTIVKGTYVAHLVTTTFANGDLKLTDAEDGFTVECGEYKYQLVNKNGSGAEVDYWGCVGLLIYGKDEVVKSGAIDYSTIKLEEVDGKPILTIGGTHENCTAEDFVFDLELSGAVVYPCTVDLSQPGKFTVTVDLSTVPPASRYYMHLKIAGVGNGNVANNDTDYGTVVSTVTVGTKTYSIVKEKISWAPCLWGLKVEDSAAPKLSNWAAELVQENGSVYLKLTATAEFYTEELVAKLAFAGKDGTLTVDQANIATLDGTTVTIKINVSDIAKKGSDYLNKWWRAYLTLDGTPIDNPNCAEKTEADLDVGGYKYELRYDNGLPYVNIKVGTSAPEGPVLNFVKGEGAEGADPQVDLGQPNDQGVYTIRLPESTYTAPANKYFRGWEVDEVVYFPGEQFDLKADAVVTFTAVWEALVGEEKTNAEAVVSRKWNASATSVNVYDGTTVKLVAQITDSAPVEWHGIINDGTMMLGNKEYFAHFRVDGYVWTTGANEGNSNTTEELKVGVAGESNFVKETYNALYTNAETAVTHVITASLSKNVLTYIYETYANYTEGGENVAATKYVWRATLSYPTSSLTMKFMIDDGVDDPGTGTMTVKSATLTYYDYALSANQAPSEENPIVIGAADNSLPYTGNSPVWVGNIKKGEKVVMKGTMTSKAESNWHIPLFHVYDGAAPAFNLRGDAYVNGTPSSGWQVTPSTEGSNPNVNPDGVTENAANWWDGVRAILAQADVEIAFDYTGENVVVIFKATSTKQDALYENFGKVYICTFTVAKGTGTLPDTLNIGLGGEACYVRLTSLARTSVKPVIAPFKSGDENAAKADKDVWYYYHTPEAADWNGYCSINMKDAKYDLDRKVITLNYETTSGENWWSVQLFYKNSTLEQGKSYKLTFDINFIGVDTATEYTMKFNGTAQKVHGGQNSIEVTYNETEGASFSLQFGCDVGVEKATMIKEANVEITNWKWEEVQSTPVEPEVPAETKTIVPVEEVNKYDPSYISIVVSSEDYELLKTADKVVVNGYTGTDWEGKGFELVGPVANGSKINVRLSLEAATPGEYVMNWVIGDKVIATYTYTVVA